MFNPNGLDRIPYRSDSLNVIIHLSVWNLSIQMSPLTQPLWRPHVSLELPHEVFSLIARVPYGHGYPHDTLQTRWQIDSSGKSIRYFGCFHPINSFGDSIKRMPFMIWICTEGQHVTMNAIVERLKTQVGCVVFSQLWHWEVSRVRIDTKSPSRANSFLTPKVYHSLWLRMNL